MSDRELLELAAKAAGLHIDDWNCDMAVMYFWDGDPQNPERNHHYWSPLTDDGDALRLAVKLGMDVCIDGTQAAAYGNHDGAQPIETGPDVFANARRAIVRAAAEIGRRMQHE
ncbi:MAG: hypothetical protein AB7N70_13810 [Dehalococcoidia bacterium]